MYHAPDDLPITDPANAPLLRRRRLILLDLRILLPTYQTCRQCTRCDICNDGGTTTLARD